MRLNPLEDAEYARVTDASRFGTKRNSGPNGAYGIKRNGQLLRVIASDGSDWDVGRLGPQVWEHVSVSLEHRCPTWHEMEYVRSLFWEDDELVLQLSVPRTSHINQHNFCLHMWRPISVHIPMPPMACV